MGNYGELRWGSPFQNTLSPLKDIVLGEMNPTSICRVSIIGTAGRNEDAPRMTRQLFERMVEQANRVIDDVFQLGDDKSNVVLVTGGSPWSDHVAVNLWLNHRDEFAGLTLHLPCQFDSKSKQFDPDDDCGAYLNTLHKQFSAKMGSSFDSFDELARIAELGATFDYQGRGFSERNRLVSECDYLIAFTWSDTDTPKQGGTLETWNFSPCRNKVHITLGSLL
jgi:hypothetical protein